MLRWGVSVACVALVAAGAGAQCAAHAAGAHDALIAKHSAANGVPPSLVRRVIHIESRGNPKIVSKGNYGLMQIRLGTARAMGYTGTPQGLLDADTNMTYAVKYLAGAYRAANGNHAPATSPPPSLGNHGHEGGGIRELHDADDVIPGLDCACCTQLARVRRRTRRCTRPSRAS